MILTRTAMSTLLKYFRSALGSYIPPETGLLHSPQKCRATERRPHNRYTIETQDYDLILAYGSAPSMSTLRDSGGVSLN